MWNIFFTDASILECNQRQCGVGTNAKGYLWQKNTRTWSAGLCSQSYAKETIGVESTGNVKTRKMEKSCCNLHNLSCLFYGVTLIELWHTVCRFGEQNYTDCNGSRHSECRTTWTLCATWIVFSAFRIALRLCRILCVRTVSFGALHIFSRHTVTSARISMPRHFVVSFHSLLVSESVFPRITWVVMKSWKPVKLEVGLCDCFDEW